MQAFFSQESNSLESPTSKKRKELVKIGNHCFGKMPSNFRLKLWFWEAKGGKCIFCSGWWDMTLMSQSTLCMQTSKVSLMPKKCD